MFSPEVLAALGGGSGSFVLFIEYNNKINTMAALKKYESHSFALCGF